MRNLTMEELVVALGLLPTVSKSYADIKCPVCGHNTLHFDFKRQVFACPACSEASGGIMDAWALFRGISAHNKTEQRKMARKDMEIFFGEESKDYKKRPNVKSFKTEANNSDLADIKIRNEAYNRLLNTLILNNEHKTNLKSRGLSEKEIEIGRYKSYRKLTDSEMEKISKDLDLTGVPGFYFKDEKWNFVKLNPGFLIPELDINGNIQAFQIRMDKGNIKYLTLSSAKQGGVSCPAVTHFANYSNASVEEIILTEGPLKASIINFVLGVPVISIPGVNAQKHLRETLLKLKHKGLKRVNIAFDMDYFTNKNVQRALNKLKRTLFDLELEFCQYRWDSKYKGYDDYLVNKRSD